MNIKNYNNRMTLYYSDERTFLIQKDKSSL